MTVTEGERINKCPRCTALILWIDPQLPSRCAYCKADLTTGEKPDWDA